MSWLDSLKASGFSDAQARALADGLQAAVLARQGELATKSDVAALKTEIAELRAEFKGEMSELEGRILKALADQQKWTIGFLILLLGILFTAIKLT